MAQVTKTYELVHPGGERFTTPDGRQHAGVRVKMPKVLDYGATELRPPRRQDVIDLCRIMNALPGAEFSVAIQYPCSDVPPEIDVADSLGLVLAITGRIEPVRARATSTTRARRSTWPWSPPAPTTWTATPAPGSRSTRRRRWCSATARAASSCTSSAGTARSTWGRCRSPAWPRRRRWPATCCWATPRRSSCARSSNAIWPGAKVLHATTGSLMNMRTAYLSMGSAETCLLSSGEMALAKYYGLPTTRMGGYSDSQWPDVQAGIEKAMAILMLAQSEADFVTMGGPLDNAAHHSYEQVVIDHDIWEMAQRLTTEIVVDDDTLAYDVIAKVGPGGSFLGERAHAQVRAGRRALLRWLVQPHRAHRRGVHDAGAGAPAGGGDPGAPVRVRRAAGHGAAHQGLRARPRREKNVAPPEWTE